MKKRQNAPLIHSETISSVMETGEDVENVDSSIVSTNVTSCEREPEDPAPISDANLPPTFQEIETHTQIPICFRVANQTESYERIIDSSKYVTIYMDVENYCREMWKYLLMWLSMEDLWDLCHVILYTGNINMKNIPKFVKSKRNLTLKPNSHMIKQLADVMITIDSFEGALYKNIPGKHVIIAGSDHRYVALQHILKERKVNCYLIQHVDPKYDDTLSKLNKIVDKPY
jgi:hypothetical protein